MLADSARALPVFNKAVLTASDKSPSATEAGENNFYSFKDRDQSLASVWYVRFVSEATGCSSGMLKDLASLRMENLKVPTLLAKIPVRGFSQKACRQLAGWFTIDLMA